MKASFYLGPLCGQHANVGSDCGEYSVDDAGMQRHHYVRVGGSTFTRAPAGSRENEEAMFTLRSQVESRSEIELAIEAYERGH